MIHKGANLSLPSRRCSPRRHKGPGLTLVVTRPDAYLTIDIRDGQQKEFDGLVQGSSAAVGLTQRMCAALM